MQKYRNVWLQLLVQLTKLTKSVENSASKWRLSLHVCIKVNSRGRATGRRYEEDNNPNPEDNIDTNNRSLTNHTSVGFSLRWRGPPPVYQTPGRRPTSALSRRCPVSVVITQDHRNNSQPSNFNAAALTCSVTTDSSASHVSCDNTTTLHFLIRSGTFQSGRFPPTLSDWRIHRGMWCWTQERSRAAPPSWSPSELMTEQILLVLITQSRKHCSCNNQQLNSNCVTFTQQTTTKTTIKLVVSPHPKIINYI